MIGNDYVRAARAKGLPSRVVITRYILRAALPSVITVLGLVFANVLTGAVLVEKIFSWPGIGQYAYEAAVNLDVPAIAGVSIFVAVVYVTINFIVDVLYGVIDPRIRLDMSELAVDVPAPPSALRAPGGLAPAARDHRRRDRGRWILIAIFAPLIAPHDPLAQNFRAAQSPSWTHLVRHRRARPRRLQPRHLRLARLAADRAAARRLGSDDRQPGRRVRRLLPRPRRRRR